MSPLEQEKALTQVATREAEIIEAKEANVKAKSVRKVKKAAEEGIRKIANKKSLTAFRENLIAKEAKKRSAKVEARKVPFRTRLSGAFVKPIPRQATRERNKAIFDRATISVKAKQKALEFRNKISTAGMKSLINREAMFVPRIKPLGAVVKPITPLSSQGTTLGGAPQRSQELLKEKINRANIGSSPTRIGGSSSILKAPPRRL